MRLFEIYHLDRYDKLFKTDLWHFDVSVWLHVFARSMIAVFIPIFLLQIGWELNEVILFYLIYALADIPLNLVARDLVAKLGARIVIVIGTIAYIGFFSILYNLEVGQWGSFITMAILLGLYDAFYWVAHMYFFVRCEKNDRNISLGLSVLDISRRVAAFLAPAAGALVLIVFERNALILVSIAFFVLSIIPLFQIKHTYDKPDYKVLSMREFFRKGEGLRDYIIQSLYSFHVVAEAIIWPIFIFTVFSTVESVAFIPIIVAGTTIFFTYFVGHIRKANRQKAITLGALLVAIVWILRLFLTTTVFYYISVFLMGIFAVFITIPMQSTIYEKGENKDALAASTYRNLFSMTPRVLIFGLLLLLVEVFQVSFLMAIAGMFAIVFISYAFSLRKIKS